MKRTMHTVLLALVALLLSSTAFAQATRTWVSGVGDDANPCSRTAPCKTFAGAISKTAAGGEINVLDPGGFGAVTITKAITIDGSVGSIAGVLVSGTNAINVNAGASDVIKLRNLDIDGLSPQSTAGSNGLIGINVLSAGRVIVENCQIYGFATNSIAVNTSAPSQLVVRDTNISTQVGGGGAILLTSSSGQAVGSLQNVHLSGVPNGIVVKVGGVVNVDNSSFDNVTGAALFAQTGGVASISNSTFSNNNVAMLMQTGSITHLNGNRYWNNTTVGNTNTTLFGSAGDNVVGDTSTVTVTKF